jgi:phenylpropionate dioxygenase-like ring-hydroxylating dioxygenase large terminal subunit
MNILYLNAVLFVLLSNTFVDTLFIRPFIRSLVSVNRFLKNDDKPIYPKLNINELSETDKYDLQWYVIGKKTDFIPNKSKKITIWSKNYVVWKDKNDSYFALDDVCPHKGASLSGGEIHNNCAVCPYHGYEFNTNGTLVKVPGINFHSSPIYDVSKFAVVEKNGWVYLNTMATNTSSDEINTMSTNASSDEINTIANNTFTQIKIFEEEEVSKNCSVVFLEMDFNCYSRILSENSLDVMHIGFVHTFGNRKNPAPTKEYPPKLISPYHYKTAYEYESGDDSIVKKVFGIKHLKIENEFILPHTTVARVIFGDYVSTVITFALPLSENKSRLFVKTYRNFWDNEIGDSITRKLMYNTMLQDKLVVENIDSNFMDGKFNMKYDKLQNTYKSFYKRFIHNYTNEENN